MEINKKVLAVVSSFILLCSLVTFGVMAESTVTTPTGTYKCDNSCVVDKDGNK